MTYAGIGMRALFPEKGFTVSELIDDVAYKLCMMGYMLHSGRADNTDLKFEIGCQRAESQGGKGGHKIFLPKDTFNWKTRDGLTYLSKKDIAKDVADRARALTFELHPNPSKLDHFGLHAMDRNAYQVLGKDLNTPVDFVIICALNSVFDDKGNIIDCKGGTGQAVRIAAKYNIPVFNLLHPPHYERIKAFVERA
jgi:hypothetical protein